MATKVMTAKDRKAALLKAGAELAAKHGAKNVTRRMVAAKAGVAESLVSNYMGTTADGQKAYARHAKKLGLTLPDAKTAEAIGAKLRAHGPRSAPVKRVSKFAQARKEILAPPKRKRSIAEVKAIKRNVGNVDGSTAPVAARPASKRTKPSVPLANGDALPKVLAGAVDASIPPAVGRSEKPAPAENKALPGPEENKGKRVPLAPPSDPGVPAVERQSLS